MFLKSGTVLADRDREAGRTASLPTRSSLLEAKKSYVLVGEASAFLEEGHPEMLEGFPEEVARTPISSTAYCGRHFFPDSAGVPHTS